MQSAQTTSFKEALPSRELVAIRRLKSRFTLLLPGRVKSSSHVPVGQRGWLFYVPVVRRIPEQVCHAGERCCTYGSDCKRCRSIIVIKAVNRAGT